MLNEGSCIGSYITKRLGIKRQNSLKHLYTLYKRGLVKPKWIDSQTIEWSITCLGRSSIRYYGLYRNLSKYSPKNRYFNSNRYHNFKVIAKVDKSLDTWKVITRNDSSFNNSVYTSVCSDSDVKIVACSDTLICSLRYSTFKIEDCDTVFKKIDSKLDDYCSTNELNILNRRYLLDKAECRRLKQYISEFADYSTWKYDYSCGYLEREHGFEFDNGVLHEI